MKLNANCKSTTANVALTGLMGAMVFLATMFFKVEIPVGTDRTMIGFANVFCILSGLLLGPVYGGAAAGVGSFLFDIVGGWFSSAPITLITKFFMAFICGAIAWGAKEEGSQKIGRVIIAAVTGSLSYCVMYLFYSYLKLQWMHSAAQATGVILLGKASATITNAIIADVIAIPLFLAIRAALKRNHMISKNSSL